MNNTETAAVRCKCDIISIFVQSVVVVNCFSNLLKNSKTYRFSVTSQRRLVKTHEKMKTCFKAISQGSTFLFSIIWTFLMTVFTRESQKNMKKIKIFFILHLISDLKPNNILFTFWKNALQITLKVERISENTVFLQNLDFLFFQPLHLGSVHLPLFKRIILKKQKKRFFTLCFNHWLEISKKHHFFMFFPRFKSGRKSSHSMGGGPENLPCMV